MKNQKIINYFKEDEYLNNFEIIENCENSIKIKFDIDEIDGTFVREKIEIDLLNILKIENICIYNYQDEYFEIIF